MSRGITLEDYKKHKMTLEMNLIQHLQQQCLDFHKRTGEEIADISIKIFKGNPMLTFSDEFGKPLPKNKITDVKINVDLGEVK